MQAVMNYATSRISHNKPCVGREELEALRQVFARHWLIKGEEAEKLEHTVARLVGVKYALAVNSGLSALHLALLSLGVTKGDQVILPTYTCVALLHAVNYVGAVPILVDSSKEGFNMDPVLVSKRCSKRTKAIIVPHTFGFPAAIDRILQLRVPVIEDCAQGLGSTYLGKPLGSFGDISVFSFYATKVVATGQGGMLATNNKRYFQTACDLVHPGIGATYRARYNYLMPDVAAAIGNSQLPKLRSFISRRKAIAASYRAVLQKKSSLSFVPGKKDTHVNHFRFIIRFRNEGARDTARKVLLKKGIASIPPISRDELLHRLLKLPDHSFPYAERLAETALSLPIYPCLRDTEVGRIVRALHSLPL